VALKKIRQEIKEEQQRQAAQSREEADERMRLARENERVLGPAVQCARHLESKFQRCSNDLARLCGAEVDASDLPSRSFWSRLLHRSAVTADQPRLRLALEPLAPEMGQHHSITLEARPDDLLFEATYGLPAEEVMGAKGIRYAHVVCKDTYPISDFSGAAAKKWLESQFENYYREMTAWKKEFPDLWDPHRVP
jgi:hypothetical protein